ncbi:MAG: ferritin family protein [Eubacteriales bacterium]
MDVLKYAIQMEKDGEAYYTKQAEINKGNPLHTVCMLLAKEEKGHAEILESKMNSLPYKLSESEAYEKAKNIFSDAKTFTSEIKETPDQLEFYRFALENEQKSIDLYMDFLADAEDEKDKVLFEFLVAQETEHYEIIDDLVRMLTNAEQWVEDAEFGVREEY